MYQRTDVQTVQTDTNSLPPKKAPKEHKKHSRDTSIVSDWGAD